MSRFFILIFFLLFQTTISHASVIVQTITGVSGVSATEPDFSIIYGGIAGTACSKTDGTTCDSCTDTTSLQACNTASVYSTLPITISAKLSSDVTNATAQLFIETATADTYEMVSSQTITQAKDSTVTFTTTWGKFCEKAGAGKITSNCTNATLTAGEIFVRKMAIAVDANANNTIEADERRAITVKLHFIPPNVTVNQSFCPTTATGFGVCNIKIESGDEKAYIDTYLTNGADTGVPGGPIDWDAVAIFPIAVASNSSGDAAAFTSFLSGKVHPIIKPITISNSEVTIADSEISGGLSNYTRYCFIYANKNKAQNIYQFVNDAAAAPTGCTTLSEVVGILEDKHCFISTAAFGSEMAPEVETFRQFRNQFLLPHQAGQYFVKLYYEFSPPLADFISKHETLRSLTRVALYPILGFSYVALNYGILAALLTLIVLIILISKMSSVFRNKKIILVFLILIFSPLLKAQIEPDTKIIQHPDAEQGLIKIKKDGTYVYDMKRPLKSESSRITFGQAMQPEITIDIEKIDPTSGQGTGTFQTFSFDDFYGSASNLIIGYDYEWFPWINKGKLGLQGGVSFMYAQGHGIKVATFEPSREEYTFITLPLTLGAVYRLEWKDKQILAPYAGGGGTYTVLLEKREDKSNFHYTGGAGFYALAGVLLNISALDDESGFALDSEYGISNLWFSLEYKAVEVDSGTFTFSNRYINAGLSFDF